MAKIAEIFMSLIFSVNKKEKYRSGCLYFMKNGFEVLWKKNFLQNLKLSSKHFTKIPHPFPDARIQPDFLFLVKKLAFNQKYKKKMGAFLF